MLLPLCHERTAASAGLAIKHITRMPVLDGPRIWHGQCGQDYVVASVMRGARSLYFVDLAANEPIRLSNTRALERDYGWSGVCIEPISQLAQQLSAIRRCTVLNDIISNESAPVTFRVASEGHVFSRVDRSTNDWPAARAHPPSAREPPGSREPPASREPPRGAPPSRVSRTLVDALAKSGAPPTIHFLSLDVEGSEEAALSDVALARYRFLTMTVENPTPLLARRLARHGYALALPTLGRYAGRTALSHSPAPLAPQHDSPGSLQSCLPSVLSSSPAYRPSSSLTYGPDRSRIRSAGTATPCTYTPPSRGACATPRRVRATRSSPLSGRCASARRGRTCAASRHTRCRTSTSAA